MAGWGECNIYPVLMRGGLRSVYLEMAVVSPCPPCSVCSGQLQEQQDWLEGVLSSGD